MTQSSVPLNEVAVQFLSTRTSTLSSDPLVSSTVLSTTISIMSWFFSIAPGVGMLVVCEGSERGSESGRERGAMVAFR